MSFTQHPPAESGGNWFPFADAARGYLSRRTWCLLAGIFAVWHVASVEIARRIGAFSYGPNSDHIGYMFEVLDHGYPTPSLWPPAFSYYLASKWWLTGVLGVPYWTAKYFVDIWLVVTSGLLSTGLGLVLTQNRILGLSAGVGLVGAPIFALGVGMEEAAILFQPFFVCSLILVVREIQRAAGPRLLVFTAAGLLMGLATLVRGNPQLIVVALWPFMAWLLNRSGASRPWLRSSALALAFFAAQWVVGLPWSLAQARQGGQSAFVFGGIYRGYFYGIKYHRGNRVADWLRDHYSEPPRTLKGVLAFNREWLKRDPVALGQLYGLKLARAWYMADSRRWDRPTLLVHFPIWIAAVAGLLMWRRRARGDPAYVFMVAVILYMWIVSALIGGIARYSAPLYGLIGTMAGVPLWLALKGFKGSGSPPGRLVGGGLCPGPLLDTRFTEEYGA